MIVAASGRAIAASVQRAGYVPLVADAFGDQDTLDVVAAHARIDLGRPINSDALLSELAEFAVPHHPRGLVWGTGFEDRPDLLARMREICPLLGNGPEIVSRIKDPIEFAALCRSIGIAHPEVSFSAPRDPEGWLVKRIGGAGGSHIRPATRSDAGAGYYFQRRVAGVAISALLLADGRRAIVLGLTEQWTSPLPQHPFRYGGAVRPAGLSDRLARELTAAALRLVDAVPLLGLNSADFLVDGNEFHLLEVNPRPSATFELFETDALPMFSLHERACAGLLPRHAPQFAGATASAIVYAHRDVPSVPVLTWPKWTRDRPVAGSSVKADAPLCTVVAAGATAADARNSVERRALAVCELLDREMR